MAKAGVLTIDVDAGTAKFLVDMDAANAKLRDFGAGAQQSGIHLVSSMQASSAAIRLLENPLGNNLRAVERFISLLPGMGKLLQAAFPVVGALAFADILIKMGTEAINFYQKIELAPARIAAAFRGLNEPLALSNDELALANDRLSAEIAKLQGEQPNTLAITLDEARVAADKLADSLDKDLGALHKLLEEKDTGITSLLTGSRPTGGDDQGILRLQTAVAGAAYTARQNADKAKTPEGVKAALLAAELEQRRLINEEIVRQNKLIADAQSLQERNQKNKGSFRLPGSALELDQTQYIKNHQTTVDNLDKASREIGLRIDNARLEGQKNEAAQAKETADQHAQIQLAQIANLEKTNSQLAALNRQKAEAQIASDHAIRQSAIDADTDAGTRAVASAEEEVRVARERAAKLGAIDKAELEQHILNLQAKVAPESVGKTQLQQQAVTTKITGPGGEVDQAKSDAAQKALKLLVGVQTAEDKLGEAHVIAERGWSEEVYKQWEQSWEKIRKAREKAAIAELAPAAVAFRADQASAEVLAKGSGQEKDLQIEGKKLALEREYNSQIIKTGADQIRFAEQAAALDSQARAAKIAGLQQDYNLQAQAMADLPADDEKRVQAARELSILYEQIADEQGKANNADYAAQTKILELIRQKSLAHQLGSDLYGAATQTLPNGIGNALSAGIFHTGNGGMDIGRQVSDALRSAGKQLLGQAFSQSIEKLIAAMLPQTAATIASTAATSVHTGVTAAGTVATTANTGVTLSSVAATTANALATAAQTVATWAQVAVSWITGFFADGGRPTPGVPYVVGEHGPELRVDDGPGTIIPNHAIGAYLTSRSPESFGVNAFAQPSSAAFRSTSDYMSAGTNPVSAGVDGTKFSGNHTFHIYETSDARETARAVAGFLKSSSPGFSPFSR
jgi:hypothetical protein